MSENEVGEIGGEVEEEKVSSTAIRYLEEQRKPTAIEVTLMKKMVRLRFQKKQSNEAKKTYWLFLFW